MAMVRKVLVVKLSSLGDVVHAMPAVQDVRRAVPGVQVDWVVERAFAPLVSRCEGVRNVIPCELRQWRKAPLAAPTRRAWREFKTMLQAEAYDAVIDLQGLAKSAWVSWLARTAQGGQRYAMANQTDGSSYEAPTRWVADTAIALAPHVHAVQRARLLCAQALGYAVPAALQYGLLPGPSLAPRKPVVAFVHGTSRADKQWPVASWVALGRRLNQHGFGVAIAHGNAAEQATSDAMAEQLDDTRVWPAMALDALTDALAGCAGVIGVDSGLSHMAVALGLPHVQLYNFDTAWRTGPQPEAASQVSVFASPCPSVDAVWQAWEGLTLPVPCP